MRRKQPSNMFAIMRLLVAPPARYDDGLYRVHPRYIATKKGNPTWKDQPPQNIDTNPYWYQCDWPTISKDCFKRLNKKGWLKEQEPGSGIWIASEKGKAEYRSIAPRCFRYVRSCPTRPAVSKYRKRKIKAAERKAYWDAWREKQNQPEPEPQPLRQERKRGKYRHDGYRRHACKMNLQDELD